MTTLPVLVAPRGTRDFLRDAVVAGGGSLVDDARAARAIVWTAPNDPAGLAALLHHDIRWVQLPWAGIEHYLPVLDHHRLWTAGQGVYADDVAEHVLALTLAALRELKSRALATSWTKPAGRSLRGARVTVFGAGGIATSLQRLLQPFDVTLTVVRHRPDAAFAGAARTLPFTARHVAVADADVVVLALPLLPSTHGFVDKDLLAAMKPGAVLVNVARGGHVDTDALLAALRSGRLGAAALDVTAPEPLPEGHPLWAEPRCLITPHCANTPEMALPVLSARVTENVRRFIAGAPLLGVVDVDAGY
jgi:phosphoglycerate dehydrogenase-like enzyme